MPNPLSGWRGAALAVLAAVLAVAPPAAAKTKHKKAHTDRVVFVAEDRTAYRTYWAETYGRGGCPPGLAKKHNGCLPPGQAKKRYVVGRALPRSVVFERVPAGFLPRLRTPPPGYEYVVVDGDILLVRTRTRLVADAIVALLD